MEACGWRPRLIPKGFSIKHPPAMRGNHVGVHVRSNDTSAAQGPRDARPTRLSSFRLLGMASPNEILVGSH